MYKIDKKSFLGVKNAGFTLIELLVVVLIIGILAAVAVPQYQKAVLRAQMAQGLTLIKSIETAEEAFYLANGVYTVDLAALDISLPLFSCHSDYCQFFNGNQAFLWELNLEGGGQAYSTYCAGREDNTYAKKLCASEGTFSHINGVFEYYYISRVSH